MKFKTVIASLIAVCLLCAIPLVGCSLQSTGGSTSNDQASYADQQFLSSFQTGLEKRWDIIDSEDQTSPDYDDEATMEKAVNAELNEIQGYTNASFSDSKLQEQAIEYINCVKDQKEALSYYNADYDKYDKQWSKAYNKRSQLISSFISDYNLTFPDKYSPDVKNLQANGKATDEADAQQDAVDSICKSMKFKKSADNNYTATVKNTTGYEFKDFSININLINSKGTVVDSMYDSVQNWKKGQKVQFDFYSDKSFKKTSVETSNWEIKD